MSGGFPDFGPGLRVLRKVGQGAMGEVYEAVQEKLSRRVAIKALSPRFAGDEDFSGRFSREAKSAAAVHDQNVVRVYDYGSSDDGSHFIVMEYVEGEDLDQRLEREGKLPVAEALRIVHEVAAGLRAAQEAGIVHRDIKPANIMLSGDGAVKITDLGLAKVITEETGFTMTGTGLGSPYFMAPEQAEDARRVDHRADMYSLGVTLFKMLTGRYPFTGDSAFEVVKAHVEAPIPMGRDVGTPLPGAVEDLLRALVAKRPEDRPSTYDELIDRINSLLSDASATRAGGFRPDWGLVACGVGTFVVVMGVMVFNRPKQEVETRPAAAAGGTAIVQTNMASPEPRVPAESITRSGVVFPRVSDGCTVVTPDTWTGPMPFAYRVEYDRDPIRANSMDILDLSSMYTAQWREDYLGSILRFEQAYRMVEYSMRGRVIETLTRRITVMNQEFQKHHLANEIKMRRLVKEEKFKEAYLLWAEFPVGLRALKFNREIRDQLEQFIPEKDLARLDKELGQRPASGR